MKFFTTSLFILFCYSAYAQDKVSEYLIEKGYGSKSTWAIIVANEDYQSYSEGYIENEELAIYQAERFRNMLIKQTGVPQANIMFYPNATNTHIKLALAKLQKNLTPSSKLIFYYRGKIFDSSSESESFMVPVDSDGKETFFMFGLDNLRKRLNDLKIGSVYIFIDAIKDNTPGNLCILDQGFVASSEGPPKYKNMETFEVRHPLEKEYIGQAAYDGISKEPVIEFNTPSALVSQTYESTVLISGNINSVCPVEVVAVGGEEASCRDNKSFTARTTLKEGENVISVEVKNCAGWSRRKIIITKLSKPAEQLIEESKADTDQINELSVLEHAGKNYALLIGISKYKDGQMPDLYYPLKDAEKIKSVLVSHYEFDSTNVILLPNPERAKIIEELDSLSRILTSEDSFLMFYAGHGSWDEKNRMGYWLPSDAAAKVLDNWIMNSIITGYMSIIQAKHILVIADACFGGSIFRTRAFIPAEEKTTADLYMKSSKKAMTSGDMTEVPDESIFLKFFLKKLVENEDNYISSEKLFFEVKPQVENIIDQIPQFGIIKNAGDEGGDFIFFKRQSDSKKFK